MQKLYLLLFSFFFFVIVKAQTTINITPVADNTIYQDFPDNSNGAGANFTTGTINTLTPRRAFVKFDVAGAVPAGATITSVTLTMNMNKSGLNNSTVYLHKANTNWGEGTSDAGDPDGQGAAATINDATWNCKFSNGAGGCTTSWTNAGGDYTLTASASTAVTTSLGNYTWTSAQMASDIQSWLNNPSTNFGWEILGDESVIKTAKRFYSRQGTNPPSLSITYSSPCVTNTWTGAVNNNWETAGNWSCNSVPTATTAVVIPSGTVTVNSNASCKSLSVSPAVSFTVTTGFVLTVLQ